ncbi:MAG TPA: DUF4129 domain-containing protein [Methylocystis sp.]|nr:DUF4129 domain-containing protein [Methylocystis sp.]
MFGGALAAGKVEARDAAQKIIRDLDLQTEPPHPERDLHHPFWLNFHLSPDAFNVLFWTLVILGLAIILWSARDKLGFFAPQPQDASQPGSPEAPSRALEEAQAEADDLAAKGEFALAMHVLLLKSLNEMRRRAGLSFKDSLTSREILSQAPLTDAGRGALGAIIRVVELTWFGDAGARAEDYAACRGYFEALRASLAGVGA